MDAAQVGVTSKWNANVFEQQFEIGSQHIERTLQTSDDNSQLIVNVTSNPQTAQTTGQSSAPQSAGGATLRFIYDRN